MPFKNILTKKIGQIVHEVIRIIAKKKNENTTSIGFEEVNGLQTNSQ